jgi:voltage-gated potassium channel
MTAEAERDAVERWSALRELEDWLETPMLVLSFVWLLLVIVELVFGSSAALEVFGTAIWILFIREFAVRLTLAPDRRAFLRGNWLTIVALVVPAFRLFRGLRILRFARAARSFRLVRIVGTANRGMNALRASVSRRGLGYVIALTLLVAVLGAGGMLAFEPAAESPGGFTSYADALWWTGMLLTTMGSDFWPRTIEGRLLCFLIALYGFAVFGYITASFASFFVERDAASPQGSTVGTADLAALRAEIVALRVELAKEATSPPGGAGSGTALRAGPEED